MTQRLYYSDSYTRTFNARIVERLTHNNQFAVVLDQTFFYPTSGGQPNDRGMINNTQVMDVAIRESDKAILHILDRDLDSGSGDTASCSLDWARRFDLMQQHTGQHILSQAFIRIARAETIGFHLADSLTIDLGIEKLSSEAIDQVEQLANDTITSNLSVRAWFPSDEELQKISLRKAPEVDGRLRVVAIGDFDVTACGGTHVAHTGEVGMLKIIKIERAKKMIRVEFMCGRRALKDYRHKNALLTQLAADFSCGVFDLDQSVAKLRAESQAMNKDLKETRERLVEYDAKEIIAALPDTGGIRIVSHVWTDRDMNDLRKLAMRLTAEPKIVALLGGAGAKSNLVFARSNDVEHDMKTLLLAALKRMGSEKGGGDQRFAQGGGIPASVEQIEHAIDQVKKNL